MRRIGVADITGQRFGKWTAIRRVPTAPGGTEIWECRCDCGNTSTPQRSSLNRGASTSCGKCSKRDLAGKRFGRWTVISCEGYASFGKIGRVRMSWLCRCDCGVEKTASEAVLVKGHTRSCGCYKRHRAGQINRTHGMSKRAEYRVWSHIIGRCTNPTDSGYPDYGARGIGICTGWRNDFLTFYRDMGARPSGRHSIDRIDNDRGYECGKCDQCKAGGATPNCRWVSRRVQNNNTRRNRLLTYEGTTLTVAQWARLLGARPGVFAVRVSRGWSVHRILTTPVRILTIKPLRPLAEAIATLPGKKP